MYCEFETPVPSLADFVNRSMTEVGVRAVLVFVREVTYCYHISSTITVFMVAIARRMIAVAPLIAITACVIANIVLSHM